MVRVCYFYSQPCREALQALKTHAPQAELVDTSDGMYAYWRELSARWDGTDDLVIIEQDNEIHEGVIESFAACSEPWCTYSYPIFRTQVDLTIGLGCTKISAEAQRLASVEAIAEGFVLCPSCEGKGCWWHLDARISEKLKYGCGLTQHVHGTVLHHHDYSDQDLGEAIETHGRAIEWFFNEDSDITPAVQLEDHWPLRDLIAVNGRQALLIAESLAGLSDERKDMAVPARQSKMMRDYWEGNDQAVEDALGKDWRPADKYAKTEKQALSTAADLALLAKEHKIRL